MLTGFSAGCERERKNTAGSASDKNRWLATKPGGHLILTIRRNGQDQIERLISVGQVCEQQRRLPVVPHNLEAKRAPYHQPDILGLDDRLNRLNRRATSLLRRRVQRCKVEILGVDMQSKIARRPLNDLTSLHDCD